MRQGVGCVADGVGCYAVQRADVLRCTQGGQQREKHCRAPRPPPSALTCCLCQLWLHHLPQHQPGSGKHPFIHHQAATIAAGAAALPTAAAAAAAAASSYSSSTAAHAVRPCAPPKLAAAKQGCVCLAQRMHSSNAKRSPKQPLRIERWVVVRPVQPQR